MTYISSHDQLPAPLLAEIKSQCEKTINDTELTGLVDHLLSEFSNSVHGICLYGSCLRNDNFKEGILDLYVIVSSYKEAYPEKYLRILNALLPPNVFYIEIGIDEKKIRAKYAVISLEDLQKGIGTWFHSYIWSRFAQPVQLIYFRNEKTKLYLHGQFAAAVIKFLTQTIPTLGPGRFDTKTIWTNGLGLTYAAELRPEKRNRAEFITLQAIDDFIRLTHSAAPAVPDLIEDLSGNYFQINSSTMKMNYSLRRWHLRRWEGRVISILRLMKAVFTFKNSVDYAAWKIKRHTGIVIKVTPVLQKHPILFGFKTLWQLIKQNAIR